MKANFGISLKIIAIVLLVSSIFVSLLVYLNVEEQKSFFEKAYIDKAVILAKSLDSGIGSREELSDTEKLQAQAYKLIWENPEMLKISINLLDGESLKAAVSSDASHINTLASPKNYISYKNGITYSEIRKTGNIQIMTVITPIHLSGQRIGTYEVEFSMSSVNEAIAVQEKKLILIAVTDFLIFIFFLLFLLERSLVRPIKELMGGVEIISKGNLEYKTPVKSNDELGRLASAFNKMTDDLKNSQENIRNKNRELEEKVAEKTNELKNYNISLEKQVAEKTKELKAHSASLEKQVAERTKELQEKIAELERFNKLAVGRELKMIELKKKIAKLEGKNENRI